MPGSFGYGDRFKKDQKVLTPGPGAYDPKDQVGFKADPKSGFLGGDRFTSQELEESTERPFTPPRMRNLVSPGSHRKYSWAAQRIHDLQEELAQVHTRCKDLDEELKSHRGGVDSLNHALEKANKELEQVKAKLQQSEEHRAESEKELAESQLLHATSQSKLAAETAACEVLQRQFHEAMRNKQQLENELQDMTQLRFRQEVESMATVERLQAQVTQQGSDIQTLQSNLSITQGNLAEAVALGESFKKTLAESLDEGKHLHAQVDTLTSNLDDKSQALHSAQNKIIEDTSTIAHLSSTLKQREAALQSTNEQVQSLQAALKAAKSQLSEGKSEIAQLSTEVNLLLEHEAMLKSKVAGLHADLETALSGSTEAAQLTEDFAADLQSVVNEISQLGQCVNLTMEELTALQRSHTAATAELQQKSTYLTKLQFELQRVHDDSFKQRELVSQLQASKVELQGQLEHLHSEYSQMQVDMVNENMKAKQLAIELESNKTLLRSALEESSMQREENEALAAEVDKLKAELANKRMMQQEMDSMRNELVEAYQQVRSSQTREKSLEGSVKKMETELAEVQLSNKDVDQQVQALQQLLDTECRRSAQLFQRMEEAEAKAADSQTMVLEMHRLIDDNDLLAGRLQQMELDLKELLRGSTGAGNLGHNNPRQKIQYHLKLKQELEELRCKCTLLLREKFHLEQCVRYLSVRARIVEDRTAVMGGRERKAAELVLPDSLAPTHLTATSLGQNKMKAGARSRNSTFSNPTREQLEEQISSTRKQMVKDLEAWKQGLDPASEASSPVIGTQPCLSPCRSPAPSPRGIVRSTTMNLLPTNLQATDSVEARILARVASVMSPVVKPSGGNGSGNTSRRNSFTLAREDLVSSSHNNSSKQLGGAALHSSPNEADEDQKGKVEAEADSNCSTSAKASSRIPRAPIVVKV